MAHPSKTKAKAPPPRPTRPTRPLRRRKRYVAVPIIVTPSREQLDVLYQSVRRKFPGCRPGRNGNISEQQMALRKVSTAFAIELRKRGWLHEEGYATGSWAALGAKD